ncbi:hypothetical protein L810_2920 [Burkholderia sp. AU4i]|jgi:hypothetical protein|uniref:Uncharacterized protein n=2 Tax=Burkholderiales TaxID=80840 RepID=B2T0T3_PARPJ|nr:hypothetical protein Bphyt_0223 [Paraburkholderia phytofirmans PsJN]ERJ34568.1 hypothetical protein L810_2920 [Burkholderia sp. AU4i]PRZ55798.1 hypothetical protein BX589_103387 [Paraburkholderia fungorum]
MRQSCVETGSQCVEKEGQIVGVMLPDEIVGGFQDIRLGMPRGHLPEFAGSVGFPE